MNGEQRLRAAQEAAAACVIRLDHDGRIVEFNAAAERLFGCAGQQALGQPLSELAVAAQLRAAAALSRTEVRLEGAAADLEALTYSISHDVRAPLRHLDGLLSLLASELGDGLSADARRFLEVISQSSLQMNRLIEDMLSLSRTGSAPLEAVRLDMRELVVEVVNEAAPRVHGRTIAWDIGALPGALGDRALLRQAWACLIDNALKFTRARPVARIAVGATQSEHEATFFVRDNGTGFDMAYAHKLFGAFQRLHRASDFEGAGIGLATVRRIISRHGGKTWAQGGPDAGATFYFSLPSDGSAV